MGWSLVTCRSLPRSSSTCPMARPRSRDRRCARSTIHEMIASPAAEDGYAMPARVIVSSLRPPSATGDVMARKRRSTPLLVKITLRRSMDERGARKVWHSCSARRPCVAHVDSASTTAFTDAAVGSVGSLTSDDTDRSSSSSSSWLAPPSRVATVFDEARTSGRSHMKRMVRVTESMSSRDSSVDRRRQSAIMCRRSAKLTMLGGCSGRADATVCTSCKASR
mmetsp:Transcript_8092/g.25865  ORF Transcript_8092/g.25865 Transcript_8092/m.25865 type:complete len:222 (-) Transcript_8092:2261-2926(-)